MSKLSRVQSQGTPISEAEFLEAAGFSSMEEAIEDAHKGVQQALEMNANMLKYGTIDAPKS